MKYDVEIVAKNRYNKRELTGIDAENTDTRYSILSSACFIGSVFGIRNFMPLFHPVNSADQKYGGTGVFYGHAAYR